MPEDATVADICVALARARTDAGLLLDADGGMAGIVTAIDLTRSAPRRFSKHSTGRFYKLRCICCMLRELTPGSALFSFVRFDNETSGLYAEQASIRLCYTSSRSSNKAMFTCYTRPHPIV